MLCLSEAEVAFQDLRKRTALLGRRSGCLRMLDEERAPVGDRGILQKFEID